MSNSVQPFAKQDYAALKRQALASGKLFVDPEFPPSDASLFFNPHSDHDFEWKRTVEICKDAQFMVDGVQGSDVIQGMLGNCWFVAACSAISRNQSLIEKYSVRMLHLFPVIPDSAEQEITRTGYAGIFHFRFWRMGDWLDVVVDDLIPCKKNKLEFARSKTENEFWIALLEKAFAKLSGCYEALVGGTLSGALMDLTGGVPETINVSSWKNTPSALFTELKNKYNSGALMAAVISATSPDDCEERLECGLVKGHSYAITALNSVIRTDHVPMNIMHLGVSLMVRLQNPWGGVEWNGPWSDCSKEWEEVSKEQKAAMGLTFDEDGEFWMAWRDFCGYFTSVTLCHRPDTEDNGKKSLHCQTFRGRWKADMSVGRILSNRAGGCLNFKESCLQNPQYLLQVDHKLENTVISLVQEDKRKSGLSAMRLTIGFCLFKVEANRKYRLHHLPEPFVFSEYANSRSCFLKIPSLEPGRYVILPTTFAPGEEGEFFIRIFTDAVCCTKELLKHTPQKNAFRRNLNYVSKVCVVGAQNLNASVPTYSTVQCAGETVKSIAVAATPHPQWNLNTIFYRPSYKNSINIQIYSIVAEKSVCLGSISVPTPLKNKTENWSLPLKKNSDCLISISVATYDDPLFL